MTEENSMSNWFQDNLRIIISVGIVILLVFAIYSYSKRDSRTDVVVDDSQIEEIAMTAGDGSSQEINEIIDEIKDEEVNKETISTEDASDMNRKDETQQEIQAALEQKIAAEKAKAIEEKKQAEINRVQEEKSQQETQIALEQKLAEEAKQDAQKALEESKQATQTALEEAKQNAQNENTQTAKDVVKEVIESRSRQKEGVIIVVAVPRDSKTTLARKAAAEYIVKNNVSGLTPAHKIYIEDYMQKAVIAKRIHPGTEMEFSNNLIDGAIEASRTLTSSQLNNLDKYVSNVSSL